MAQVIHVFEEPVVHTNGVAYRVRVCARQMPEGTWQGWFEFIGPDGEVVRSQRETTQPSLDAVDYWVTGLTQIYLEGALERALAPSPPPRVLIEETPAFDAPAPPRVPNQPVTAVLNPYSVREKGVDLLRSELGALDPWHLRNIMRAFDLVEPTDDLEQMTRAELVELIVLRTGSVPAR